MVAAAVDEHELEEVVASLQDRVNTQADEIERLNSELARAHDWRYHLESHARDARAVVVDSLRANRAPSKAELQGIERTLTDGIGWTGR